ncbi:hypothetical protein T261_1609 [Streptomyces lydicus]|nr:hypothetical protein T261_1609 [Streptomyces lydicus]
MPIAALSAVPGRLLSRYSGTLAAANSAAATRRVAAMAGPVLIAAGLSAMLLCGNSVSQERDSRPTVVSVSSRTTGPAASQAAKERPAEETRLRQARAEKRQERNAVGMRILMVPLITFSGIGILNTLLLATRRRRQEFAVLRLTGSTRDQLLRMLSWESAVVVLSGLGAATAVVAVSLAALATRLALPATDLLTLLPRGALAQVALGCAALGLLGVIVPAVLRRGVGVTYFHGCYSVGDDRLWGVNCRRTGTANTLAALKSIRAARPDDAPIHIILDNLSAHTGADIRRWAKKNKVELCFTPTYASWANPIEAHFGPLRQFTLANSRHRSHPAQTQALHRYPALAQHQRQPPRRTRRPTQGTRPHPQREGHPLGRTPARSRSLNPANLRGHGTSRAL